LSVAYRIKAPTATAPRAKTALEGLTENPAPVEAEDTAADTDDVPLELAFVDEAEAEPDVETAAAEAEAVPEAETAPDDAEFTATLVELTADELKPDTAWPAASNVK